MDAFYTWAGEQGISPNHLMVLHCIYNNRNIPDSLHDELAKEIPRLIDKQWLIMDLKTGTLQLTIDATSLLTTANVRFAKELVEPVKKVLGPPKLNLPGAREPKRLRPIASALAAKKPAASEPKPGYTGTGAMESFQAHVRPYQLLFPAGRNGNAVYRSNPTELRDKFHWFFRNYPQWDWDTVFKATNEYMRVANPQYIRTASYFIRKQDDKKGGVCSDLASFCDLVEQQNYQESPAHSEPANLYQHILTAPVGS